MASWLIVILLASGVSLGVTLAVRRARGIPTSAWLGGLHLLLGFATLEPLLISLRGVEGDRSLGLIAAGLVGTALFLGLVAKLARARVPTIGKALWLIHASAGAGALVVLVAWVVRGPV